MDEEVVKATEEISRHLAALTKANGALWTALLNTLMAKGVLDQRTVEIELLGGLREIYHVAIPEGLHATGHPNDVRADALERYHATNLLDVVERRLFSD